MPKDLRTIGSIAAAVGILALLSPAIFHFSTRDTVQVKVIKTERVSEGSNSKYLIFTENETFENVDSMLAFKFNSSDVYGRINEGAECTFDVAGKRWRILSMYRNILDATCKS